MKITNNNGHESFKTKDTRPCYSRQARSTRSHNDEPASVLLERIRAEKERLIKEGKIKKGKKSAKTSDKPHYPFELPKGWVWTTLGEILELISGQDFPPEKYNNEGNGIPYIIGASNIENERLFINRWTKTPSVLSFENDLLVVCKGAGVGKMAFNNVGTVHIARQIQAIRNFSQNIVTPFIKIIVLSSIGNIVSKANGLIPGLKRELLLSMFFPFPPYNEQQRIVDEIQHWFSLIDIIENDKVNLQNTIKQAKAKVLDLPSMVNSYRKTRMTSQPANCSNASIQRLKSLVITPNMASCRRDGAYVRFLLL